MKEKINLKIKLFLLIPLSCLAISCKTFETIEENEKESKEIRQQYSFAGTLFKMFIYIEPSMKGDKIHLDDGINQIFDGYINTCPSINIGVCEILEVDNSGDVNLKINDRLFEVPSSKVLSFRYLIVKKKGNRYIFKYTNYPRYF